MVAALLRVARVTAGLAKSNGSLPYARQSSMGYLYFYFLVVVKLVRIWNYLRLLKMLIKWSGQFEWWLFDYCIFSSLHCQYSQFLTCSLLCSDHYREHDFYRAMLCICGTSHGPVSVSVSVSVTSRCSTKTAKCRITYHTNNTTRYPRDSSFLKPKISAKFDQGHPLRGRQMQVVWVKIGDFRQITGHMSKTVEDRHIVFIKVE